MPATVISSYFVQSALHRVKISSGWLTGYAPNIEDKVLSTRPTGTIMVSYKDVLGDQEQEIPFSIN